MSASPFRRGSRSLLFVSWGVFLLWFLVLNILSSIPNPEAPSGFSFPMADKVVHFLLFYFGAASLANAAGLTWRGRELVVCCVSALLLIFLGVGDEFRQLLVPGRSGADFGDMLANALGSIFGGISIFILHGRFISKCEQR